MNQIKANSTTEIYSGIVTITVKKNGKSFSIRKHNEGTSELFASIVKFLCNGYLEGENANDYAIRSMRLSQGTSIISSEIIPTISPVYKDKENSSLIICDAVIYSDNMISSLINAGNDCNLNLQNYLNQTIATISLSGDLISKVANREYEEIKITWELLFDNAEAQS